MRGLSDSQRSRWGARKSLRDTGGKRFQPGQSPAAKQPLMLFRGSRPACLQKGVGIFPSNIRTSDQVLLPFAQNFWEFSIARAGYTFDLEGSAPENRSRRLCGVQVSHRGRRDQRKQRGGLYPGARPMIILPAAWQKVLLRSAALTTQCVSAPTI